MLNNYQLKQLKNDTLFANYFSETNTEIKEQIKETIFRKNLALVKYIANKYINNEHTSVDEFISIGTLGLTKAFNTFKPEKNYQFVTYASMCIHNQILCYLRDHKRRHKDTVSLEYVLSQDVDGNSLTIQDTVHDVSSEDIEKREKSIYVQSIIDVGKKILSGSELRVFENFLLDVPKLQREMAKELGLAQSYISRLEKKAINKVKAYALAKKII